MSKFAEDIIKAIQSGDVPAFEEAVDSAFQERIEAKMEDLQKTVAETIFETPTLESVVESYEQLDEISKQTLGSYLKKASTDVHNNAFKGGEEWGKGATKDLNKVSKHLTKSINRQQGIAKAVSKLTKEDFDAFLEYIEPQTDEELNQIAEELISELSKGTLVSYIKKVTPSLLDKTVPQADAKTRYKSMKHLKGIDMAANKLQKEEAEAVYQAIEEAEAEIIAEELVNEISKGTLGSYIKKANWDLAMNTVNAMNAKSVFPDNHKIHKDYRRTGKNRIKGIELAVNKLTKEHQELFNAELEQLKEAE